MRSAFRLLTSVLWLAVVVQVGLAGYGAFRAIHKADTTPISKKAIEDGFNAHAALGTLILVVMLALLIVAAAGRLGAIWVRFSAAILALGVLLMILGIASTSVSWLGFLHTVTALALFALSGLLAHRAWTQERVPASAPVTSPAG